jgi:hypothetical protein
MYTMLMPALARSACHALHLAAAVAGGDPFLDQALQHSVDTVQRIQKALAAQQAEALGDVMQDVRKAAELWGHLPAPDLKDGVDGPDGWQVSAALLLHASFLGINAVPDDARAPVPGAELGPDHSAGQARECGRAQDGR